MSAKLTCFYCQSLKNFSPKVGKCAFCGVNNPLYLIIYQNQPQYFCCGCSWWQMPHNEAEQVAEEQWYQEWKKTN